MLSDVDVLKQEQSQTDSTILPSGKAYLLWDLNDIKTVGSCIKILVALTEVLYKIQFQEN